MEWSCGMQVTGFIIIHNNNIGCLCVNVSALKICQNIFPTLPKAFSIYSTELKYLHVSSPIYQATFPNNKKTLSQMPFSSPKLIYVSPFAPSRQ